MLKAEDDLLFEIYKLVLKLLAVITARVDDYEDETIDTSLKILHIFLDGNSLLSFIMRLCVHFKMARLLHKLQERLGMMPATLFRLEASVFPVATAYLA
jgi:hypothetical protein